VAILEVAQEPVTGLAEYGQIPIAFEVRQILDVSPARDAGLGFALTERFVEPPFVKDYDSVAAEHPSQWARRFDVSKWGLFAARLDGRRVGGVVVAHDTAGVAMLEGRHDLAVLWDIRVAPDARRHGVASALFAAAEAWAVDRGCTQLKVETQNVNVAACRFYEKQGCVIAQANYGAYADVPDEVQLIWCKSLSRVRA
jgi:GNAT superfamily N-acetyltransferase